MLKNILLVMCFLVLLSSAAQAEVVSEVDNFDKTKYVYSYVRLPGVKGEGIELKNLIFRKTITAHNIEYMLILTNEQTGYAGEKRFPVYNDFLVKFDNNNNEIYVLSRKGDFTRIYHATGGTSKLQEIGLNVSENITGKILSNNKITLRIPLYPENLDKSSIRNFIIDIPKNIINEWRQVIQSNWRLFSVACKWE